MNGPYYLLGGRVINRKKFMGNNDADTFNEKMRCRTKAFAINVFIVLNNHKTNDLGNVIMKQLTRCSSSVASNFRAAARGRSEAEFYSKICIVVEECDETVFWIEYLVETGILKLQEIQLIKKEAEELLHIFSTIKRKLRNKRS